MTPRNLALLAGGLLLILVPWLLSRAAGGGSAAAVQTAPGTEAPSMGGLMARALGSLLVVLALLLGAAWFARRYGMAATVRGGDRGGARLRVEDQVGLAGRQTLYVVRYGSRRFLVGSGQQGVRLVARLERRRNRAAAAASEVVA